MTSLTSSNSEASVLPLLDFLEDPDFRDVLVFLRVAFLAERRLATVVPLAWVWLQVERAASDHSRDCEAAKPISRANSCGWLPAENAYPVDRMGRWVSVIEGETGFDSELRQSAEWGFHR